jgi:predicted dienelactone hydrolase
MRLVSSLSRLFGFGFIAVLLVSCAAAAPPAPTPVPTPTPVPPAAWKIMVQPTEGSRPDMPAYAVAGPYPVGLAYLHIPGSDYKLETFVYFPLGADGTADSSHSPYPLLLFSPGLTVTSAYYTAFLNHIASFGFVVIAGEPRGETDVKYWPGAATRVQDTKLLLDYAEQMNAPGGQLAGLINIQQVGIAGHSSGGWTALVGGGAQMDFGWCAANPDLAAKLPYINCPQFVPHQDEIAAMLGLKAAPAGLWPQMNDPRIKAVITMAPDGDIWGAEYGGVASMKLPVLVMTGAKDEFNQAERCAYPIYEHLGSPKKTLVTFADEGHMFFITDGEYAKGMVADVDLYFHFATAFLLAELKGDPEAAKAILPANAVFPGVTMKTTVADGQ